MTFEFISGSLDSVPCDAVIELITSEKDAAGSVCTPEITELTSADGKHRLKAFIPAYSDTDADEELLRTAYENLFQRIAQQGYQTVALPLSELSPLTEREILSDDLFRDFPVSDTHLLLVTNENRVCINPYLRSGLDLFLEIASRISEKSFPMVRTESFPDVPDEQIDEYMRSRQSQFDPDYRHIPLFVLTGWGGGSGRGFHAAPAPPYYFPPFDEENLGESFYHMVLRKIDEKGFRNDADCYKRGNLTASVFSEMRCKMDSYQPSKQTALAFCIALKLSLKEASELLSKAGYSFSNSILTDVIVEYCIMNEIFNIVDVNILLFEHGQKCLGHKVRAKEA